MSEAQKVLDQMQENYDTIHENFYALIKACGEDESRMRQVANAKNEAFNNVLVAGTRILNANKEQVDALGEAAEKAQEDIDDALKSLEDFKATLALITKAVKTVGILVGGL